MLFQQQKRFTEESFSMTKYEALRTQLQTQLGCSIEFRMFETPVLVSDELRDAIASSAIALVMQSADEEYKKKTAYSIAPEYNVPAQDEHTMFAVVDFAITQENGKYVPKLIELQGFPSLFGYQALLADAFHAIYPELSNFRSTFAGLERESYIELLSKAILNGHHPDNTALVEYNPYNQKTLPDFMATQQLIGVAPTDIREIINNDGTLFHKRGGAIVPLRRIYNRAIVDELEDNNVVLPFNWNDKLNVEWAGHPNWYFQLSKYSLPFLNHHSVPHTEFLDKISEIPKDLDKYVLKPLFAFAGKGVNVNPTPADIDAIPFDQRDKWVLMEKIDYADCLYTPLGMNKLEIRCMLIWLPDSPEPIPTVSLVRTGRGTMMGARFNNTEWTGATCCFFDI